MLLLAESFDWIDEGTTSTDLTTIASRKWGSHGLTSGTDAIIEKGIGGNGMALALRERDQYLDLPLHGTVESTDVIGCSCWVKRADKNSETENDGFFGIIDTDGSTYHMNLRVTNSGFLAIYRGNTLVEEFSVPFESNEWHHYAFECVIDETSGSWEVKYDGVTIGSATTVDTRNGGDGVAGYIRIEGIANYQSASDPRRTLFDNVVAWNDAGTTLNTFPDAALVLTLFPESDGDDEDWSTSSGIDSYALVDETAPHDDDANYIESSTSTNSTLFHYGNIGSHTNFYGIQINSVAKETDVTDFTLRNSVKQGGTNYPQTAQAIAGTSYENIVDVLGEDPNTASPWDQTGINSMQAGVEVG